MYGLCDCNNFFASCERVFNPSLNGKPVVVLSNNDGCIIARSNEAKAVGIGMGTPLYQAQELIKRHGVKVFSSNYQLYGDMSARVMATLRAHVESVEVYSIDEAFLHFEGYPLETLQEYGQQLARTVHRHTGIPVSIGIAPTKTLAKVASKLCKKYPKLQGCCLMHRPEDIEKVLRKLPIGDVWGIGRKSAKRLATKGVATAWEFVELSPQWVQENMTITGLRIWRELKGEPCIEITSNEEHKQSISITRSFAQPLSTFDELHHAVATFTAGVAEKLRQQGSCAQQLKLFVGTNRHREDQPQHYEVGTVRFTVATDSTLEMTNGATEELKRLFQQGFQYKRAGITALGLVPRNEVQGHLFDPIDRSKHKRLMEVIDRVNSSQGRNKIHLGAQGEIPQFSNRNFVSPRYTTSWDELMEVKI